MCKVGCVGNHQATMTRTIGVILLFFAGTVEAGEYCITAQNAYYYEYTYCTYACCGEIPNEYCCFYTWAVAVSVVGGIVFLSCIIGVVCCIVKNQGHSGRVVNPAPTVSTVAYSTTPAVQTNPYGYQQPSVAMPPQQALYPPPHQQPGLLQNPYPTSSTNQPQENPGFPPMQATQTDESKQS